jgi:hypothetical protein
VGTTQAVLKRFWLNRQVNYLGCERTLVKFEVRPLSSAQVARSALRLSRRLPFFARMVSIKLARRRGLHGLERRLMTMDNEPLMLGLALCALLSSFTTHSLRARERPVRR